MTQLRQTELVYRLASLCNALSAERTLIVSGALERCLTSKVKGHERLKTPHLKVEYQAPAESHHGRF